MRTRLAAALAAFAIVAGCKRDWITIPAPPATLVVHGVLNPADNLQYVLIERTLTGVLATPLVTPFSPSLVGGEPVLSDGGIPERGATTELVTPSGQVIAGSELPECLDADRNPLPPQLCRGNGAGVYKFYLSGSTLVPGGRYAFRATTTEGEVITAETIVPETPLVNTATLADFNRSVDTLSLAWADSPRAPAYQVRIESPFGAWLSFTDSTRVALTGNLRNPDDPRLSRVFVPGFRQLLTVTAIDANLYDYYRTSNNSFIGYGAISRVNGAFGVFGSAVTVLRRDLTVTANQQAPIEGIFDAVDVGLGYIYFARTISLFIESSGSGKSADAVSGMYYNTTPNFASGALGTFRNNQLQVAFLRSQARTDTAEVLFAELRGDTIVGTFRQGAPARYVRRK